MHPIDCLRSATVVAASVLGLEGKVGTLAAGAFGDLVGVAVDPLADLGLVARAENVSLVLKAGAVVKDGRAGAEPRPGPLAAL